jgi:hypothetical protein
LPTFDLIQEAHHCIGRSLNPIQPVLQPLEGVTSRAQAGSTSRCQRSKDKATSAVNGSDPRGDDSSLKSFALKTDPSERPKVKSEATTRNWVKARCPRHHLTPTVNPFTQRNLIPIGFLSSQERSQISVRSRPTHKTPKRPPHLVEPLLFPLQTAASQGKPKRKPVGRNTMACDPAQIRSLRKGQSLAPPGWTAQQAIIQRTHAHGHLR